MQPSVTPAGPIWSHPTLSPQLRLAILDKFLRCIISIKLDASMRADDMTDTSAIAPDVFGLGDRSRAHRSCFSPVTTPPALQVISLYGAKTTESVFSYVRLASSKSIAVRRAGS
jgi:hypothetical protein